MINTVFIVSWVLIRLIMFPFLLIAFTKEYIQFSLLENNGNFLNIAILGPIIQFILTAMTFKWTYEIVYGKNVHDKNVHGKNVYDKNVYDKNKQS